MRATVERATLLKGLSHVQSVVERRNTIPILSNVLIEASESGAIKLTATDLDLQIVETFSADVEVAGATTVSAHTLFEIARKLPEGSQVQLHAADGRMAVNAGRARFSLATLPRDDFPMIAEGELPTSFEIPAASLIQIIDKTRFAISTEETRYYLNGIFFHATTSSSIRAGRIDHLPLNLDAVYKVNMSFGRHLDLPLAKALKRPWVHLLFGARQTGKSTLLADLVPDPDLSLDFSDPAARARYLSEPGRLIDECLALPRRPGGSRVLIDEAQAVPEIFDAVQNLFDRHRGRFRFVLSGSSVRKLRVAGANLLPGRSMVHHLFPLTLLERAAEGVKGRSTPLLTLPPVREPHFAATTLVDRLAWGELPGVARAAKQDRARLLEAYALVYLEEELRRETLIKSWPAFARFLKLAAIESGQTTNFAHLSNEAGVSVPTVASHYQLLEDMFLGFRVHAFSGSKRKHVLSTPRFFFFDLGVRHAAAGLNPGRDTVLANPGPIFEQWVGLELWKRLRYRGRGELTYWRTKAGAEVDFVIDAGKVVIPIEVKWTENPSLADARHLRAFMADAGRKAPAGYVVCRCERPRHLAPGTRGGDAQFHAADEGVGVNTCRDVSEALAEERLGEHRGSRRAVAGLVAGLGGGLLHQFGTHVLRLVGKFDLLGDAHTVLGDGWAAPGLIEHGVAAAGTECGLHRPGEFLDTGEQGLAGVNVEDEFFGGHGGLRGAGSVGSISRTS